MAGGESAWTLLDRRLGGGERWRGCMAGAAPPWPVPRVAGSLPMAAEGLGGGLGAGESWGVSAARRRRGMSRPWTHV